jgi:hypothetical protein
VPIFTLKRLKIFLMLSDELCGFKLKNMHRKKNSGEKGKCVAKQEGDEGMFTLIQSLECPRDLQVRPTGPVQNRQQKCPFKHCMGHITQPNVTVVTTSPVFIFFPRYS